MNQESSVKQIIGIAAGKGGVGKSTVTVNLAYALASLGAKVGVLDADIYGPSIRLMIPEDLPPMQDDDKILPAQAGKLKLMSIAYFGHHDKANIIRAPIANSIIQQFIQDVKWGDLDYLLIDFPPGTGDVHLTILQGMSLTGVLLVTTPQQVALLDVKKAHEMFVNMKVPIIGAIENMSFFEDPHTNARHFPFGQGAVDQFTKDLSIELLGQIPIEGVVSECSDLGQSLIQKYPTSAAAKAFLSLATDLEIKTFKMKQEIGPYLEKFELKWEMGAEL